MTNEMLLNNPLSYFGEGAPRRVVSLVPSWTATLYDFGLASKLIGITDYCPAPETGEMTPDRIGAPKSAQLEQIVHLKPDLVIANQEENARKDVEALASAGLPVWLTFPKTVKDMLADLWTACSLFRSDPGLKHVQILENSVEWAELALGDQEPVRYFCPIWQEMRENGKPWWMTFNGETYSSDMLRLLNGENIFFNRRRVYPLDAEFGICPPEDPAGRDERYPRVSFEEIYKLQPEVILLPSEPYSYQEHDIAVFGSIFANTPAGQAGKIYLVEGSLIHWPGTILGRALHELSMIFFREQG